MSFSHVFVVGLKALEVGRKSQPFPPKDFERGRVEDSRLSVWGVWRGEKGETYFRFDGLELGE